MIIYIHGFNSSPQSYKAQLVQQRMQQLGREDELIIPMLSCIPGYAISELTALVEQYRDDELALIGSSLGGYYATVLTERYNLPSVLINPAVKPYELLRDYLGKNINHYTGEAYELTLEHMQQLRELDVADISHLNQYLVMLQTGDEVLDYSQAMIKFAGSRMILEDGGGHEFQGFDNHLDTILEFCGLKNVSIEPEIQQAGSVG